MNLTELQIKQLRLLKETVDYYSVDPINRRSLLPGSLLCVYSPHAKSQGCAIGRLISKELAKYFDRDSPAIGTPVVDDVFHELPIDLQKLGLNYLVELQVFHDSHLFWNTKGLTIKGTHQLNSIRSWIMEGTEKFDYIP